MLLVEMFLIIKLKFLAAFLDVQQTCFRLPDNCQDLSCKKAATRACSSPLYVYTLRLLSGGLRSTVIPYIRSKAIHIPLTLNEK